MGFAWWFFKGGNTQNRWALVGDFSKGGIHKTDEFWWVIFQRGEYTKPMDFGMFFLLLLKIKRSGRLFRQIRHTITPDGKIWLYRKNDWFFLPFCSSFCKKLRSSLVFFFGGLWFEKISFFLLNQKEFGHLWKSIKCRLGSCSAINFLTPWLHYNGPRGKCLFFEAFHTFQKRDKQFRTYLKQERRKT